MQFRSNPAVPEIEHPFQHQSDHVHSQRTRPISDRKMEKRNPISWPRSPGSFVRLGWTMRAGGTLRRRLGRLVTYARPRRGGDCPSVLTAEEFRRFYLIVDRAEDVQHSLMLRLLFFTGVRVRELCRIEVGDVDLENCKIFISQGKAARTGTCCSVGASPRHYERTWPPISITAICSRRGGPRSSAPVVSSRSSRSMPRKLVFVVLPTRSGIRRSLGSPATPGWPMPSCS